MQNAQMKSPHDNWRKRKRAPWYLHTVDPSVWGCMRRDYVFALFWAFCCMPLQTKLTTFTVVHCLTNLLGGTIDRPLASIVILEWRRSFCVRVRRDSSSSGDPSVWGCMRRESSSGSSGMSSGMSSLQYNYRETYEGREDTETNT